jgi:hypothetical protein
LYLFSRNVLKYRDVRITNERASHHPRFTNFPMITNLNDDHTERDIPH